jgi:hypothetical protein
MNPAHHAQRNKARCVLRRRNPSYGAVFSQNVRLPNGFGGILTFSKPRKQPASWRAGDVADWPVNFLFFDPLAVCRMGQKKWRSGELGPKGDLLKEAFLNTKSAEVQRRIKRILAETSSGPSQRRLGYMIWICQMIGTDDANKLLGRVKAEKK